MLKIEEGESFRNSRHDLHSSPHIISPDLEVVLTWIPAVLVLVVIICESFRIRDAKRKCLIRIPWNPFNGARIFLVVLLLILALIENGFSVYFTNTDSIDQEYGNITSLLIPYIKSFSYLTLVIVYWSQRRAGIHTSASIWIYLIVQIACDSLNFYEVIILYRSKQLGLASLTFKSLQYSSLVSLFLLECRGDTPVFIPDTTDDQPESLEPQASFLSVITFWWFNKFMFYGFKNRIRVNDIWRTLKQNRASVLSPSFTKTWMDRANTNDETKSYYLANGDLQKSNSSVKVLLILFWKEILVAALLMLIHNILLFVNPLLLKGLLNFIGTPHAPVWIGGLYTFSLLLVPGISAILLHQYLYSLQKAGQQAQSMLISSLYRKALLLSNTSRMQATGGDVNNLLGVDSQRLQDGIILINFLWSTPLQVIFAIILLYLELGWSIFGGVIYMVLTLPLNTYIAKWYEVFQTKVMLSKDRRIKKVKELLSAIKVIKLYAWENSFLSSLLEFRDRELKYLTKVVLLDGLQEVIWLISPTFVAIVTFGIYVSIDGNELTAEKAFVSISLFNLLKTPLLIVPAAVSGIISAHVSARRINNFLNTDELFRYVSRDEDENAITIEEGTASWSETGEIGNGFLLSDINLQIKPKSFVAIVGQVGSGKSSLLSSIFGEMKRQSGRFNISKDLSLSYVPQQAWIQNMTIKDNILFGEAYDEIIYHRVLSVCSLLPDLAVLPGGDLAEIGEKGINLSGGQKQRVSLARACYFNSDIYLLDDPLSALDSHVGKHVFDEVLSSSTGYLRDKTRVLATNNLFVVPYVDHIIVLENGRIVESGKYSELMAIENGHLSEFMRQYSRKSEEPNDKRSQSSVKDTKLIKESSLDSVDDLERGKLTYGEETIYNRVDFKVYLKYFKALSISWVIPFLILETIATILNISTNFWLATWSSDIDNEVQRINPTMKWTRLAVYAGLGSLFGAFFFGATLCGCYGSLKASRLLHSILLDNIIHSPMSFFDTTPMGRIMNRLSKDINVVDQLLPQRLRKCLSLIALIISTLIINIYSFPLFIFVAIPIGIIYNVILRIFLATTRQMKRIEPITKSPLFSHFNETVNGASSIRAYNCQDRYINTSDRLTDVNCSSNLTNYICDRWLCIRLELIGGIITSSIALFAISSRETISSGVVGLALTYSLDMTQFIGWFIWQVSELETSIISVDRILEYSANKQEDCWVKNERPPTDWPSEGEIRFQNYSTRYRENTDLVLHDISLSIRPSEKIGIVGRTGSGKSSLALSLFRLIEPASGCIIIDGLNLIDYGLHDIRSKLTIIPQDPVLFSGTLRYNIDPLDQHSEAEIWRALELSHLKDYVKSLDCGLDHAIYEHGENFSVGQRQLICLVRAILRKTKILILDEATASVDVETDSIVQKAIREIFADCTVLTIAHRLHSVLDSDRILVLDKGEVRELGSPSDLLSNEKSVFTSLVRDAGIDASTLPNRKFKST